MPWGTPWGLWLLEVVVVQQGDRLSVCKCKPAHQSIYRKQFGFLPAEWDWLWLQHVCVCVTVYQRFGFWRGLGGEGGFHLMFKDSQKRICYESSWMLWSIFTNVGNISLWTLGNLCLSNERLKRKWDGLMFRLWLTLHGHFFGSITWRQGVTIDVFVSNMYYILYANALQEHIVRK